MSSTDFDSLRHGSKRSQSELLTPAQQLQRFLEIPVVTLIGLTVLFLATFGMAIDLSVDNEKVGLDKQVLVKLVVLAGCGLYGVLGVLIDPKVRRVLTTLPVVWMGIILGFYLLAVPGSKTPIESLVSAASIACVLLMTVTALVQLGTPTVLATVFHAISAFVILSWATRFLMPEIGMFEEPIGHGEFKVRMSGMAHPNTLGQYAGLLIVIGVALAARYRQVSVWRWGVILLAAAALVSSLSRTSLLATMVATAFVFRKKLLQRQYLFPAVCLLVIGTIGVMFASMWTDLGLYLESKLVMLSKTGDAEELTSATGRVDIWAYAIHLIGERPLTGYGAATSKFYLSEFSHYTHNLILNVAFSTGVIGGLAAICMCFGRIVSLFRRYHLVADALVVFILVNGLFENVIFSILAGMPTIVWTIALCLPSLEPDTVDTELFDETDSDRRAESPTRLVASLPSRRPR